MFLELHMIQNFAPSNLNRDDTGSPKDCEFGGYRRARISSQCLKRAIRTRFSEDSLLPPEARALRTKRLLDELIRSLRDMGHAYEVEARRVIEVALGGLGLKLDKDKTKTEYLLFLGPNEIRRVAEICHDHWGELAAPGGEQHAKGKTKREQKKESRAAVAEALSGTLKKVLDGGKAADLALFGRMLADLPDTNVDAACQVAHAISTHKVSVEFDYYTAVDDLAPREETGAGMLGTVEFNSACFYRYANVDLAQLHQNLQGDTDLARDTVSAFVRASVLAIPTGKQNSMAAQNPPSLIFGVLRKHGLWSLTNAFVRPVQPTAHTDLVGSSIRALDEYWGRLVAAYGPDGVREQVVLCLEGDLELTHLEPHRVPTLAGLVDRLRTGSEVGLVGAGR